MNGPNRERLSVPELLAAIFCFGLTAWAAYNVLGPGRVDTRPALWITWFVGAVVIHDFWIYPLYAVVALGFLKLRLGWMRGPAALGGMLVLVFWPSIRGWGHASAPDNATILPNNYGLGVLVLTLIAFGVAGLLAVAGRMRANRGAVPTAAAGASGASDADGASEPEGTSDGA